MVQPRKYHNRERRRVKRQLLLEAMQRTTTRSCASTTGGQSGNDGNLGPNRKFGKQFLEKMIEADDDSEAGTCSENNIEDLVYKTNEELNFMPRTTAVKIVNRDRKRCTRALHVIRRIKEPRTSRNHHIFKVPKNKREEGQLPERLEAVTWCYERATHFCKTDVRHQVYKLFARLCNAHDKTVIDVYSRDWKSAEGTMRAFENYEFATIKQLLEILVELWSN